MENEETLNDVELPLYLMAFANSMARKSDASNAAFAGADAVLAFRAPEMAAHSRLDMALETQWAFHRAAQRRARGC